MSTTAEGQEAVDVGARHQRRRASSELLEQQLPPGAPQRRARRGSVVAGGTSPAARADDAGGDDATDATTPVAEKVRRAGRRGSVLGAAVDAVGEGAKKGRARRNSTVGAVPAGVLASMPSATMPCLAPFQVA